ncbi:hypothetical protein L917_02632 [Phytophthora nicotianae]|uniref:Uncharacterized protein n=1 Tax=Phytophthora nicotianae TaxID=4792 RepID=W2LVM8_PHYNI|nr:hypothetical protein L917_02632 [Phytophthora nicotianae]
MRYANYKKQTCMKQIRFSTGMTNYSIDSVKRKLCCKNSAADFSFTFKDELDQHDSTVLCNRDRSAAASDKG